MTAELEVRNLHVETHTGVQILSDVSFSVDAGHIMGLVGESGSGKSTTALATLAHARRGIRITSGEASVLGENLLRFTEREVRARRGKVIAYVPQSPPNALNPTMTVGRHLAEMMDEHLTSHATQSRIAETLENVDLPDDAVFLRRYPHQLSGGQQQRLVLALAFICKPAVIVLDEPTTGLDVTTQSHILATIRRLCANLGTAAVYVSHDLAVIGELADEVSVMYAGRIVEYAPALSLFRSPAHPYTRALLSAVPDVTGQFETRGIAGAAPQPGSRPVGCDYWPRCSFAIDVCREVVPVAFELGHGRLARCYRAQEVAQLAQSTRLDRAREAGIPEKVWRSVLSVSNLNAYYRRHRVLQRMEFEMGEGECLAIVGESGSGKTTLARCVAGLHREADGTVSFRGDVLSFDARNRTARVRQQIQIVFQNPDSSLNPRRTVEELIRRPLQLFFQHGKSEARPRVIELLRQVGLPATILHRYPHELSGGERQRVAIARALAAEPALLICDEITSSLDVSVQASIMELLRSLRSSLGLSLLFITHNLALVHVVADTLIVMRHGDIVESGPALEVLRQPANPYTRVLLESSPKMPTIASVPGVET